MHPNHPGKDANPTEASPHQQLCPNTLLAHPFRTAYAGQPLHISIAPSLRRVPAADMLRATAPATPQGPLLIEWCTRTTEPRQRVYFLQGDEHRD
jgi:hypothetical protein